MPNTPQIRDTTGRFVPGQSGNPGGRPKGFRNYINDVTADGNDLVDFVISVFRGDHGEDMRPRMDAATWLADRGFGKPTVDTALQPPEDRRFMIDIGTPLQEDGRTAIEM